MTRSGSKRLLTTPRCIRPDHRGTIQTCFLEPYPLNFIPILHCPCDLNIRRQGPLTFNVYAPAQAGAAIHLKMGKLRICELEHGHRNS